MRWWIPIIVLGWAGSLWLGLSATIPVGVLAQDVREEAAKIQAADQNIPAETAVQAAVEYLETRQRRRLTYLFAAYLTIWALLALYLFWLAGRQKVLEEEIQRLREQLESRRQ